MTALKKSRSRRKHEIDPFNALIAAFYFEEAAKHLLLKEDANVGLPYFVLSAFSIEVYLKCLLAIEGREIYDTHDLHELFQELGKENKRAIQKTWAEWQNHLKNGLKIMEARKEDPVRLAMFRKQMMGSLPKLLKEGAKTFVTYRYFYEKNPRHGYGLQMLPPMLKARILEVKPEWGERANSVVKSGIPPTPPHAPTMSVSPT